MVSTKWDTNGEDALKKFILNNLSNCIEIQNVTDIGQKFLAVHPVYKGAGGGWASRIRNVLNQIRADDYDGTTLARLMFCLSHPLQKLKKVREKIGRSGDLRVNSSNIIIYYKDDHVELAGTRQDQNKLRIQKRKRKRQIEAGMMMRFEREAHEMGEREQLREEKRKQEQKKKIKEEETEIVQKENIQNQIAIKFEYGGLGDQNGDVNDPVFQESEPVEYQSSTKKTLKAELLEIQPKRIDQEVNQEYENKETFQNVENGEVRAPATKKARVEEPCQRNEFSHLMLPVEPAPLLNSLPTPAHSAIGSQEKQFEYRSLLKSILNYSHVMDSECFENLQADVSEELNEPDVANKQISEQKISEAIREGIKATTTRFKAEPVDSSNAFSLREFFRFWKLKLLEMEFGKENELVTEISTLIRNPDLKVTVKLDKIRLGLEMTLTKLRQ